MVEPFKLRLKVGPHEFEAEGDQGTVERQFALWRELIEKTPVTAHVLPSPPPATTPLEANARIGLTGAADLAIVAPPATPFNTVFQHQGEIVSLSVLPTGDAPEADAALLLLLGYLWFTKQELVTGGRLGQGLARSGLNVARTDRVLADYMPQLVIRVGQHRGTRYRLTNPGKLRAEQMVRDLAATVG